MPGHVPSNMPDAQKVLNECSWDKCMNEYYSFTWLGRADCPENIHDDLLYDDDDFSITSIHIIVEA